MSESPLTFNILDFKDDFQKYKEAKERYEEAQLEFSQDKLSEAELKRMKQWHDDAWERVCRSHGRLK